MSATPEAEAGGDVGNVMAANSNNMDWSDCYGLARGLNTMDHCNEAERSAAGCQDDGDMSPDASGTCSVSYQCSLVDDESGYCDSLSTSTDKDQLRLIALLGDHTLEDDDDENNSGDEYIDSMPLFVNIGDEEPRAFYCATKQGSSNMNGAPAQIISAKGTVRGVKNRVRSNVKRFLEHKPIPIKEDEASVGNEVIVYTTSLRSVRRTFDDCSHVKKILQNNRIKTDERDIFLHHNYRVELATRLEGRPMAIPLVFVKGELLGGREQVEKLNESGALKDLAATLERLTSPIPCTRCGGFRFVNCTRCSGSGRSRRMRISREINSLRCTSCKKGLAPCPECNSCLMKSTDVGDF